jgi:ubiquitin C-terminal hydrolase
MPEVFAPDIVNLNKEDIRNPMYLKLGDTNFLNFIDYFTDDIMKNIIQECELGPASNQKKQPQQDAQEMLIRFLDMYIKERFTDSFPTSMNKINKDLGDKLIRLIYYTENSYILPKEIKNNILPTKTKNNILIIEVNKEENEKENLKELIDKYESKQKTNRNQNKKLELTDLPKYLMIQLKLQFYNEDTKKLEKINKNIQLPANDIVSIENKNYKVKSIVQHKGTTLDSGHYINYSRRENYIIKYDDKSVTVLNEEKFSNITNIQPYLILLENNDNENNNGNGN